MLNIEEMIVCSICNSELDSVNSDLQCSNCEQKYHFRDGVYNMIPENPPASLEDSWALWKQIQYNGEVSYNLAPELNLSSTEEEIVNAFINWTQLDGCVLDIGCGPQTAVPAYISQNNIKTFIGLDPLDGQSNREFSFVQGIAETIPFRKNTFNHITFYSSFDHLLNYQIALNEAYRLLLPDGKVHIVADLMSEEESQRGVFKRFMHVIDRGLQQIFRGIKSIGVIRTIKYVWAMIGLKVPEGAEDYFHSQFPTVDEIRFALNESGFTNINEKPIGDEIILTASKPVDV